MPRRRWITKLVNGFGFERSPLSQGPCVQVFYRFLVILFWSGWCSGIVGAQEPALVEFNRDIRPILSDKCFACHGPDGNHREADLRLDEAASALADRGGYAAVVPGDPDASALIERITSDDESLRMPPADSGKQLTIEQIDTLRQWIAAGAPYQPHWAYVAPRHWPKPSVSRPNWARDELDVFLLARMDSAGLVPAPEADRRVLIRRLYFDLWGLPPLPEDVAAFLADERPDAYERLVDRLLAAPHFGERMAIFWLDLIRYADTVGYHGDQEHHISPFRDYVIQAFNDNLLFDQFTREQLAGDLLPGRTEEQWIASGYNRLLQTSHEGGVQIKEYLTKYSKDRVRNLGAVWLGSTLGCAECHDHKFDPFTQRDFYSVAAFFADIDELKTFKGGDTSPTKREPEISVLSRADKLALSAWQAQIEQLDQQIAAAEAMATAGGATEPSAQQRELQAMRDELNGRVEQLRSLARRTMVTTAVEPRPIRILNRGDWMDESGEIVQPATPAFLPPLGVEGRRPTRLDLANWLTAPDHPLTARVLVNRVWTLFFGAGLYTSLEDLGAQGQAPNHPELLDELAMDFVASGWDVKRLVRRIVTSSAYRQTSLASDASRELDPENIWFARQSTFRLPAEMIRDQALSISGLLVTRVGGPSSRPYQPDGYYQFLNFPKRTYEADQDAGQYRRAVYMHWQRQFLHPMLRAFDAPSREECTAQRPVSNTPLAALTLLNDPSFLECSRVLAARLLQQVGRTDEGRVRWAWRLATSREPEMDEVRVLLELYEMNRSVYSANPAAAQKVLAIGMAPVPTGIDPVELAAWTQVTRAILNLNETITRP